MKRMGKRTVALKDSVQLYSCSDCSCSACGCSCGACGGVNRVNMYDTTAQTWESQNYQLWGGISTTHIASGW